MTKKTTKRALIVSMLSMFLCFTMMLGTTYAWFTDSVTSSGNIIKTGTLDVTFKWADGAKDIPTDENAWTDASTGAIFKYENWEPGYVATRHMKIANVGTLDFKYQLNIVTEGEVSKLANVIDVYFFDGGKVTTRDNLDEYTYAGTLAQVITKGIAAGTLDDGATRVFTIVLKMQETAGNEYQNLDLAGAFSIQLVATQKASENDDLGTDYDKNAWAEGMQVRTADELRAALSNGASVTLVNDIELTESVVINAPAASTYSMRSAPAATVINLNGNKITANLTVDAGAIIVNNGNTVINGDADSLIVNNAVNGSSVIKNNGTLVINGGTYQGAPTDTATGTASYAINTAGEGTSLTLNNVNVIGRGTIGATKGTKVEINGGTYHTPAVAWGHAVYAVDEGTEVVINDGTFSEGYEMSGNNWGMYQIYSGNKAKVIVNGGDFSKTWDCANGYDLCTATEGTIAIYGGVFADDPSNQNKINYVAEGYKAVKLTSSWMVVPEGIKDENVVDTTDKLAGALTNAGAAGAGDNTIVLAGDIDLSDTTWTPISVDGYHGAGVITIDGNGATIKGLTAPLFAGGFAGESGIVIKNLTIADSNIVSTSGLGGGAFIDTADSMQVVTLENCHLVNSTVSGERTGGLIGWCSGYAQLNDGPVKTYVTITNCSVVDSTVIGAGSAGAIAGHPGASDFTYTTIENCVVKNVDVISNETGSWRTGAIVGTANNGHIVINNVTVEDVTLTQNGVTAENTVLYGRFVPAGTGTLEIDGKFVADGVKSLDEMLLAGKDVVLSGDLSFSSSDTTANSGYGATGVSVNGGVLDGNGYSLGINNWGTWDAAVHTTGGTIKNITINSGMRGIFMGSATADVYIDNVVIDGTIYTFNSDGGSKEYGVYISNSTLNGWTSHSDVHKEVVYTNCDFGEGNGYAFCRPYGPTEFVGCDFEAGFALDAIGKVTFKDCTIGGVALTADNLATLVKYNIANATVEE